MKAIVKILMNKANFDKKPLPFCLGVIGPAGSGKSTMGRYLSDIMQIPFIEGDDFHSQGNQNKMKNGIALNDRDRIEWLIDLRNAIKVKGPCVFSCSALKYDYRKFLIEDGLNVLWILPYFDRQVLSNRLQNRKNHFFNPELLSSQLDTWEPLTANEKSVKIPIEDYKAFWPKLKPTLTNWISNNV